MDLTGARWRTSTYSSNGGNTCVEVATDLPGIWLRYVTRRTGTGQC
jgi:Domain of unknown function (DUF397)